MKKSMALVFSLFALAIPSSALAVNLDEPGGGDWQGNGSVSPLDDAVMWLCYDVAGYNNC